MPPKCSVCIHPDHQRIDQLLLNGDTSLRNIAERFGLSATTLHRHRKEHLAERLAKVAEHNVEADVRTAIDVRSQLAEINDAARAVLTEAQHSGESALALQAIDRVHRQIELQAKLIDLIRDTTVNVTISPQWLEVRAVLTDALRPYPEAARAVASGLSLLSGETHGH